MLDGSEDQSFERLRMIPASSEATIAAPDPVAPDKSIVNRAVDLAIVGATLLAILYVALVAPDHYESASSFVVRSLSAQLPGQLTGENERPAVVRSLEDAHIVRAYLSSRDAVDKLASEVKLAELFGGPDADLLFGYPGFLRSPSRERLYRYALGMIDVEVNAKTGVSFVRVRAFRPEDAKLIIEVLLRDAEAVVNALAVPRHADAIETTKGVLERARMETESARARLEEFRREYRIIDPTLTFKSEVKHLSAMSLEAAEVRVQISDLARIAPGSPQLPALTRRLAAIDAQAEVERMRLTGGQSTLGALIGNYERLVLERTLAEKSFQLAEVTLDLERSEGRRQHYFIDIISRPSLPDYPAQPRRALWTGLIALIGATVFWGAHRIGGR